MDASKPECGDYRCEQEWLVKENGERILIEEVHIPIPHKWKRVCTTPGGAWGPAEYDEECAHCGMTRVYDD